VQAVVERETTAAAAAAESVSVPAVARLEAEGPSVSVETGAS